MAKTEQSEARRFYTIEEVAEDLGVSLKIIRRYVASGQLAADQRGSKYLISESSYSNFCAQHTFVDEATGKRRLGCVTVQFLPGLGVNPEEKLINKTRRGRKSPASRKGSCEKRVAANAAKDKHAGRSASLKERQGKTTSDDVNWQDISDVWDAPGQSEMTFVDLFCGAGGLSKGLELSGMKGVCGLDWFDEAGLTYARNFDHPFINGDIKRQENKQKFYETVRSQLNGRHLNLVAGGFPCQGFSMAGNRIVDDPRNSLYKELVEIVKNLKPDFVLCENVKGLRSMLNGAVERKIIEDFRAIGYQMNVTTLCAADYYTPQKRERVIFIGNRIGVKNLHPQPILKPSEYVTTGEAIGDLMAHPDDPAFNHVPTRHSTKMIARMSVGCKEIFLHGSRSDADDLP